MQNDNIEFPNEFYGSLFQIQRFEGLQSLVISFHPDCAGPDETEPHVDVEADVEFRFTIFQRILSVIGNLVTQEGSLQSFSVNCLQGYVDPRVVEKPVFVMLLRRLRSLSLHVVREQYSLVPEMSIYYPEIHDFYDQLPNIWLQPASSTLTTLSLYGDDYWGWCPKVEFRDVHFPSLQVLALGNFTFSHDWQPDWIAKHGQTLVELYLDDCPIVFLRNTRNSLDEDGYPIGYPIGKEMEYQDNGSTSKPVLTKYETRWSHYYKTWSRELRKLSVFEVGSGEWEVHGKRPFLEYHSMTKHPQSFHPYISFNMEWHGPSQWIKPDPVHSMHVWKGDNDALEALWHGIDARNGVEPRSREWGHCRPDCPWCAKRVGTGPARVRAGLAGASNAWRLDEVEGY